MDYMCRSITGVSFGSKKTASSKSLDLRIIWPSSEDVRNSLEGWAAGCSIPCPSKNMKPFLRKFLYKWSAVEVSGRGRAMPHIKCYFQPGFENSSIDWFLLTSANLSSAAWGSFQKDDSQLMIRSYEAGVLFLDSAVAQATPNFSCTPDRKVPWANTFPTTTEVLICKLCHVRTSIPIEPQIPKLSLGEIAITLPIPFEWNTSRYDNQDDPWVWDIPRAELDVHGESYLC